MQSLLVRNPFVSLESIYATTPVHMQNAAIDHRRILHKDRSW
ncbi:MAG: hypothetical protein VB140_01435 [Burkholderia sp.]